MEPELKQLLDEARGQGASAEQLQGIVNLYRSKKKSPEPALAGSDSPSSSAPAGGTSPSGPVTPFVTGVPKTKEPKVAKLDKFGIPAGTTDLSEATAKSPGDGTEAAPPGDFSLASVGGALEKGFSHMVDAFGGASRMAQITQSGPAKLFKNMGIEPPKDAPKTEDSSLWKEWGNSIMKVAMKGTELKMFPTLPDSETFGDVAEGSKKFSGELQKDAEKNPLPNNIAGKVVGATIELTPTILALMATGGGSAEAQLLEGGSYLTGREMLQGALTKAAGPLTRYLAATKSLEGFNAGYNETKGDPTAIIGKTVDGFNEGVTGGVSLEGLMAAGGQIGGKLFTEMLKKGIVNADGVLTEQALKSFIGTPAAFAANSVAEDVGSGRPVNWENAGVAAATALPFEAMHMSEAYSRHAGLKEGKAKLDKKVNDAILTRDNNSVVNFMLSSPEEITAAMSRPESFQELQVQAIEKGMAAAEAKTYQEKNALHLDQVELQKAADLKRMGDTITGDGIDGFNKAVANMELPQESKDVLLNKANAVNSAFNPIEAKKADLGKTVADLDTQIQSTNDLIIGTEAQEEKQGHYLTVNELTENKIKSAAELFELTHQDQERQKPSVELADQVAEEHRSFKPETEAEANQSRDYDSLTTEQEKMDFIKENTEFMNISPGTVKFYEGKREQIMDAVQKGDKEAVLDIDGYTDFGKQKAKEEGIDNTYNKILKKYAVAEPVAEAEPAQTAPAKTFHPVKNDFIGEAEIADVLDNGDIVVRDAEGNEDTLPEREWRALDITDEDIKKFKDSNKDFYPEPEQPKDTNVTQSKERQEGETEFDHKVRTTESSDELATMYNDEIRNLQDNMGIEGVIADYNGRFSRSDFERYGDKNHISTSIARNYFARKGESTTGMDQMAMEMNNMHYGGKDVIQPEDIYQFAVDHPAGYKSYFTPAGNENLRKLNDRYREITGKNLRKDIARKLAEKYGVSNQVAEKAAEVIDSPETTAIIDERVDDLLHTEGLMTGEPDYDKINGELDRYLEDPANDFNIWHPVFEGRTPDEAELTNTKTIIDEYRERQKSESEGRDQEPDAGSESGEQRPEEGADEPGRSSAEPARVADEYDEQLDELDYKIERAENALKKAAKEINKANDIFSSSGVDDGGKKGELFSTAADVSTENVERILKPLREQIDALSKERERLVEEKDKAVEQASRQTVFSEAQASKAKEYDELVTPEVQEQLRVAMRNLFPKIDTQYHETIESFNEAAKQNGMANALERGSVFSGFVDTNRVIHFNPEATTKDTQLHEQGHILTNWAYHYAPALFDRMMRAGRSMGDMHQYLNEQGYELAGERLFEEAFVTALGRDAQARMKELIPDTYTRNKVQQFIKEAWVQFQRWVEAKTGFSIGKGKSIDNMTIDEFLKHISEDYLLSSTKISDISSKELAGKNDKAFGQAQMREGQPTRNAGESLRDFAKRVADWKDDLAKKPAEPEIKTEPEKPGYDDIFQTGIKNKITAEERERRGLDKIEIAVKRDFGTVFDSGKKMVDDGLIDPHILAKNIIERPRPLSAEETAALVYDRMRLYNDHRQVIDDIVEAQKSGDAGAEAEHRVRMAYIEEKINTNDIAARKAGYEQGLGLAARKMMIANDYSLANQLQLAKVYNNGADLPADIRKKFETLTSDLEEANKKLLDYENGASQRQANKAVEQLKKEVVKEVKKERYKKTVEKIRSERKDILTELKQLARQQRKKLNSGFSPEMLPVLARLAKNYMHEGVTTVAELVDTMYDDIKDDFEGLTKRELRDAISGYGKTMKPSQDELAAQLRELKSQARLISALEDASAGEPPLKSGLQREAPSDAVRELQKKVQQAMRENGIEIEAKSKTPEEQWKSALDAIKSRLKNQITDLTKQLETGEKTPKKVGVEYDAEAKLLRDERDRLKSMLEEVEGKPEMSDEQRVAIAKKALEKSIAEYERRIDQNDLNPAKAESKTPETPELTALRERLKGLKDTYGEMQEAANPKKTPEERALEAYKSRTAKRIDELQAKMDAGDFEPEPKREPMALDEEGRRLQSNIQRIKNKMDMEREKIRLENRTGFEKGLDYLTKWRRAVLLSSVTTLGKLSAAASMRQIFNPLEEVIGHGLSAIPGISKISEMAPREGGGFNAQAEARAITEVFKKATARDVWTTVTDGHSELDIYGDKKEVPHDLWDFFGQLHAAIKVVPKRNEFFRSFEKRTTYAIKEGFDVTDPVVQTAIAAESYKDANRAIFMQSNFATEGWNSMIKYLESKGAKGEIPATMAKILFPIIKVPANFTAEVTSYVLGGVKAMIVLRNGISKLTPEQADYVMRNFKKQSIGAAFYAMGFFNPQAFGGYYQENDKRKRHDLKAGDVEIFGTHIPHWLLHAPPFEVMQMGATMRRVQDKFKHKRKSSPLREGLQADVKGLFGQVPFFAEPAALVKASKNSASADAFAGELFKSFVIPPDVVRMAKMMDEKPNGEAVKRKEVGFVDHVQSGIPGLRNKLKKKR